MAVPVVTCDAKIVVAWNEGAGSYNAALSATATGSPTGWTWTILSVPVGLEAILSGTWGDFTDGVATTGAGASAVGLNSIPTDVVAGTIVVQAVATNGDGPSVPTVDKASGQQCVVIKTELLDLPLPGDREYAWGQGQLDEVLRKLEAAAGCLLDWDTITWITNVDSPYAASIGEMVMVDQSGGLIRIVLPTVGAGDLKKVIGVKVYTSEPSNIVYANTVAGVTLDDAAYEVGSGEEDDFYVSQQPFLGGDLKNAGMIFQSLATNKWFAIAAYRRIPTGPA